jgi:hypothetical protein
VDGSFVNRPHCVGFQSTATNLSPKDALPDSDVYVRDLRSHRTILLSDGIAAGATNVSLAGNCKKAVFEAGGRVWWTRVGAGAPRALGDGSQPNYSRDGKSITYVGSDGRVIFRHGGLKKVFSEGDSPRVSDYSSVGGWAVAYNSDGNVKLALIQGGRARLQTADREGGRPRDRRLGKPQRPLLPQPPHRQLRRPRLRTEADHPDRRQRTGQPDRLRGFGRRGLHRRTRQPHAKRLRQMAAQVTSRR